MIRTTSCKTKLDKSGAAQPSVITFDYEGVTIEDLYGGWEDGAVIKLQAKFRRDEVVPAKITIKVKDMAKGRAAVVITPEMVLAQAAKMTPEERTALIAKLQGK